MLSLTKAIINTCIENLQVGYRQTCRNRKPEYANLLSWVAKMALEKIATSNAPYHNVEHTVLVTLVGQEILRGKQRSEGNVSCEDWLHFMISLLCHDIGYVQLVCRQDQAEEKLFASGVDGESICLPQGSTDASLTPYHVDRGKLFIEEYFADHPLIDIEVIKQNIEMTRFPVPADQAHQDTVSYPGLVRAADLIGQLSDPYYLQKIPALFAEFEETGANQKLGYHSPKDLRLGFPSFFWKVVYRYIQQGLGYLELTPSGRKTITNLYRNVFTVEEELLVKNALVSAETKLERSSLSFPNCKELFKDATQYEVNKVPNRVFRKHKPHRLSNSAEYFLPSHEKSINFREEIESIKVLR